MNTHFQHLLRAAAKGDTSTVAALFQQPGGRKYLENITLILIHTLPHSYGEKEELYQGFVAMLDRMEKRIRRQKEGQKVLEGVFKNH